MRVGEVGGGGGGGEGRLHIVAPREYLHTFSFPAQLATFVIGVPFKGG